jgi:hypothetical protein
MKNLLTCDINRRIYMSNGTRQRCSKSRVDSIRRAPSSARMRHLPEAGRTLGSRVVRHQAPSLSLSPACSATLKQPVPVRRRQGLLYRQALAPSGRKAEDLRRLNRLDPERDRRPSRASDTPSWGRPWLTAWQAGNARCGWEYQFDRLWAEKLAQVYACLVPEPIPAPRAGLALSAQMPPGGAE